MSRSRLGVVVIVPGDPGREVNGLRRALGHGSIDRIAPHITLVPPVNVNSANLGDALDVVRSAASSVAPMQLELGPTATFWPETPVVFLAVGGDVAGLHALRTAVFAGPLARPLTRPFVPHVTLAEDVDETRIPEVVAALGEYRTTVTIDRVHVLRQSDEHHWEAIADAPLAGPVIIGRGGLEVELRTTDTLGPDEVTFLRAAWSAYTERVYGAVPPLEPFAVTARREGAVVGVATGEAGDDLRLHRLVVDAAASGQGIGSHLLREVERIGGDRRCRRAVLVCRAPTASWYADRGWRVGYPLPSWSHGADFVRMVRDL